MSPGELVIRRGMLKQDEIGKTSRTNEFIGTLLLPDGQFSFRGETSLASTRRPNAEIHLLLIAASMLFQLCVGSPSPVNYMSNTIVEYIVEGYFILKLI